MAIVVSRFRCSPDVLSLPQRVIFTIEGTWDISASQRRLEIRLPPEHGLVFAGGATSMAFATDRPLGEPFALNFQADIVGERNIAAPLHEVALFDGQQLVAVCPVRIIRDDQMAERKSMAEREEMARREELARSMKSLPKSSPAPASPRMPAPSGSVPRMPIPAGASSRPKSAQPPSAPKAKPGGGRITVWFGTNRKPEVVKGRVSFTSARDQIVHYGTCEVSVPSSHRIGSVGSPWWKRIFRRVDDRLKIESVTEIDQERYWQQLAAAIRTAKVGSRDAVVFLHGFNVAFTDAALRAAQLGYDLGVAGAMAFYSWPSQGVVTKYPDDEASIEASEPFIADYLASFATRSGAERVHLIAHSMGNRGLLRAINRISVAAAAQTPIRFNQIILAAADVDQDTFRHLSVAYQRVAERTTMYVCSKDRAVEASQWLHGYPRAGLTPPVVVVPGIDTISVSNLDLTMLAHGYVADARDVLHDMHRVLRGSPPAERFGLRRATTEDGEEYWVVGA